MSKNKDKEKDKDKTLDGGMPEKAPIAFQISRQLDQEKIHFLAARVEELLKSNSDLRSSASQNEKDTHDIVLYFQREMEIKDEIILRLNEELVKCQTQLKFEVEKARKAFEEELYDLRTTSDNRISTLTAQLDNALNELNAIEKYRQERHQHEDLIQSLNRSIQQQRDQFIDAMEEQERRFLEEKSHLFKDLDEQKVAFREVALQEARSLMGEDVKKIIADNARLYEELRFHHAESADFQAEKTALTIDLAAAKREATIFAEKELEYAKQAYNRTKEIKMLRERVEFLEKQQALNVEKFKQRAKELKSTVTKELEEATLDAAGLRRLIHIKNKELKHMKSLAATILSQRTETEQFFLEALQEVKEVIRQERKQKAQTAAKEADKQIAKGTGTFPPLNIKPANMHLLQNSRRTKPELSLAELEKVTITDLSWEDKELVLRVLFSKMNGMGQPANKGNGYAGPRTAAAQPFFISEGAQLPASAVNMKPFEVEGSPPGTAEGQMQRVLSHSRDVEQEEFSTNSVASKIMLPTHQQQDQYLRDMLKETEDDEGSTGSSPSRRKGGQDARMQAALDDEISIAGHSAISSLGSHSRGARRHH